MIGAVFITVLLLMGCHRESPKEATQPFVPTEDRVLTQAQLDSLKEDSLRVFYERMRRWNALHGGILHRESEK